MAVSTTGTLLAMLLIPELADNVGVASVVVVCALCLMAVGAYGVARHATWREPASMQVQSM